MRLEYSEPNIPGNFSHLRENGQPDPDGAFHSYGGVYGDEIVRKTPDQRPYAWETVGFLASRASNVYSSDALELGTDPAFPRRDETGNEGSNALYRTLILKANKYNGIFGSSDTVQPAGLYAQMLIRAYQA